MVFRGWRPQRGARDPLAISSCPMSEKETSSSPARDYRRIAEDEKAPLVRGIFDSVAPRYDLMNDLMSGGIHRLWKAEMVAWLKPRPGQRLIDVAGGTGDIALRAFRHLVPDSAFPNGSAVVCDTNERMLEICRARALDRGILYGIGWLGADAERLPFAERSFDLYTIAFGLRNVTRIEAALAEARRVLKPGGRFMCLEFTPAIGPPLQPLYDYYSFHVVPRLGQIVTGDRDAYTYLVESIRGFPRQGELAEMIAAAGLDQVRYRNLMGGIAALHSAWRL
jgi:demethylmenaquinone methyltransferase / 2-methoxy-6-polyprenyl-1,4-benzoquinol methylase